MRLFIKTFFKEINNNRNISFINVIGYAIALSSCILLGVFIYNHINYDKFHENINQIYRLNYIQNKKATNNATTNHHWFDVLPKEMPGVIKAARFGWQWEQNLEYDKQTFKGQGVVGDIEIFEVFSFPTLEKNGDNFFEKPNSVAISESLAKKIFGKDSPIGKNVILNYGETYTVTAVFKDIPSNSTLKFDFITDIKYDLQNYGEGMLNHWLWWCWRTFILLDENISDKDFGERMKPLQQKYIGDWHANTLDYYLQPFEDIHLHSSDIDGSFDSDIGITLIYVLSSAVILILLISCINYINLTIAAFESRKKSVAIKKIIGASRITLFKQYLSFSLVQTIFCVILAVILSVCLKPILNAKQIHDIDIPFAQPGFWIIMFVFGVLLGTLSGFYPAHFISRTLSISKSLKRNSKSYFRNILITVQFAIAIILLISVTLIKKQLKMSTDGDLGFNHTTLISISATESIQNHYEAFHDEMRKTIGVETTTSCNFRLPGHLGNFWNVNPIGTDSKVEIYHTAVAPDFFEVMKIPVRSKLFEFTEDTSATSLRAVINHEATQKFALGESILGKNYYLGDSKVEVIGIVDDFYISSTYNKIQPIQFNIQDRCWNYLVRLKKENQTSTINELKRIWNEFESTQPFEFQYVDDLIAMQYTKENAVYRLFNVFFILAMILSLIGLFGLVQMIVKFKIKEIGVRKVTGAKTGEILILLNSEFIIWVILAFLLASPVAWYSTKKWLENFAYKTPINWWIFAGSGLIILFIASLVISIQSWRIARKNPVEALRYE